MCNLCDWERIYNKDISSGKLISIDAIEHFDELLYVCQLAAVWNNIETCKIIMPKIDVNDIQQVFNSAISNLCIDVIQYIWENYKTYIDLNYDKYIIYVIKSNAVRYLGDNFGDLTIPNENGEEKIQYHKEAFKLIKYMWEISNYSYVNISVFDATDELKLLLIDICLYGGEFSIAHENTQNYGLQHYTVERIHAARENFQPTIREAPKNMHFMFV